MQQKHFNQAKFYIIQQTLPLGQDVQCCGRAKK